MYTLVAGVTGPPAVETTVYPTYRICDDNFCTTLRRQTAVNSNNRKSSANTLESYVTWSTSTWRLEFSKKQKIRDGGCSVKPAYILLTSAGST
ncbi:unnamed protein product [Heligmosomoides polygyrus]|uniref:Secreted protein n=1 Tax=Heligmosomoides polygyrus TaxID=6339 RepID=A0A183FMH7_HELPZ|nr:unnamed protein product [Heligmosomoides polygyrus]